MAIPFYQSIDLNSLQLLNFVVHSSSSSPSSPKAGMMWWKSDESLLNVYQDSNWLRLIKGPSSSTNNNIPQWNGTTGDKLKNGLSLSTTISSPGVDTAIPTEKAVRTIIDNIWTSLPTASESVKGGIKVGSGLSMDGEFLNVDETTFDLSNYYNKSEINAFFEGESYGKKQVDWARITSKPSTFTPSSHTHGSITNDGKIGSVSNLVLTTTTLGVITTSSRSGIDSRTSFPPEAHTHDDLYLALTIWNQMFSLEESSGTYYIKAKLDLLGEKGIAAYTSADPSIPSIWDSIPFATTTTKGVIIVGDGLNISEGVLSVDGDIFSLTNYYTKTEIDDFFEGEASGKKQVHWDRITSKPSTFTPSSHTHGSITNDGRIGSTSNLVLTTTTNGVINTTSRNGIDTRDFNALYLALSVWNQMFELANDGTTDYIRAKLDILGDKGIAAYTSATPVVPSIWDNIPYATTTTKGVIIVGTGLSITDGVLSATGTGVGSVTSVGLSVPTGFSVANSPITSSGTLALTFSTGYSLPTNAKQQQWDEAYSITSQGSTVGTNIFKLTNPSAIRFLRLNADNTVSALSDSDFRTAIGAISGTHTHGLARHQLHAPAFIDSTTNSTNFRTKLFGSNVTGYELSVARLQAMPDFLTGFANYGTMIAWGGWDTHGFLYMNHSSARAKIGGGSNDNILWSSELVLDNTTQTISGAKTFTSPIRMMKSSYVSGSVVDSLLTYSTDPFGLLTRLYSNGAVGLQAQRENDDNELFPLTLQPLGGSVGIGTTIPASSSLLDVRGDVVIGSTTDNTTDTKQLTIQSNGHAGIVLRGDLTNASGEPGGTFIRFSQENDVIQSIISSVQQTGYDGSGAAYAGTIINGLLIGTKYSTPLMFGTNTNVRMTISSTGAVSMTSTLTVSSTVTATNFIGSSDIRYKHNIQPIKSSFEDVVFNQFTFKSDLENRVRYGVIAQELEKTHPELVYTDDKGYKSVAYTDLLIGKIHELEIKVKELERRLS